MNWKSAIRIQKAEDARGSLSSWRYFDGQGHVSQRSRRSENYSSDFCGLRYAGDDCAIGGVTDVNLKGEVISIIELGGGVE